MSSLSDAGSMNKVKILYLGRTRRLSMIGSVLNFAKHLISPSILGGQADELIDGNGLSAGATNTSVCSGCPAGSYSNATGGVLDSRFRICS